MKGGDAVKIAMLAVAACAGAAGCPRPAPPPAELPAGGDAGGADGAEPGDALGEAGVEVPAEPGAGEPPPLTDPRFRPLGQRPPEGTPPTLAPTPFPEGVSREVPDIGDAARASLREQFGCELVEQVPWPAAWLSPMGVVLRCCRRIDPQAAPPDDVLTAGCMVPFTCTLLIDEGIGAVTEVRTVTDLRRRVAPLRDPATALAVVDAVVRDVVPFFGDRPDEAAFVREGSWRFGGDSLTGTRIVERLGGGFDVTTYVRPGCGCSHDLVQVQFYVDELAGVTEQSRATALQDLSGLCVD